LKKGAKIPEPVEEKEDYSGRFIVRIPKTLHYRLALEAKKNRCSLNQYVTHLLSSNFHLQKQEKQFGSIKNDLDIIKDSIWKFGPDMDLYRVELPKKRHPEIEKELRKQNITVGVLH
jgi:hypothetical protein